MNAVAVRTSVLEDVADAYWDLFEDRDFGPEDMELAGELSTWWHLLAGGEVSDADLDAAKLLAFIALGGAW